MQLYPSIKSGSGVFQSVGWFCLSALLKISVDSNLLSSENSKAIYLQK